MILIQCCQSVLRLVYRASLVGLECSLEWTNICGDELETNRVEVRGCSRLQHTGELLLQNLVPAEDAISKWICVPQGRVHSTNTVFFVFHASKVDEKVSKVLVPGDLGAFVCVKGIKKAKRRRLRRLHQVRNYKIATVDGFVGHFVTSLNIQGLVYFSRVTLIDKFEKKRWRCSMCWAVPQYINRGSAT